jgi:hypothetical protein
MCNIEKNDKKILEIWISHIEPLAFTYVVEHDLAGRFTMQTEAKL